MSESVLQLGADDLWGAFEALDPVAVLAEELIERALGHPVEKTATIASAAGGSAHPPAADDLLVLEGVGPNVRCVLSATGLRRFQSASFAALAARELLASGGVTVAMFGALEATQAQLAVIARHVPDISHVAICIAVPAGGDRRADSSLLDRKLVDQLELSGIGLSVVTTLADTVFGANLVVAAGEDLVAVDLDLRLGHLAGGTVLVNTTGHDLPAALADAIDQVYVDDLELLAANRTRHVVAGHLAGPARIVADLGQLLVGARAGRRHADDVLLVELLGTERPSVRLAVEICRVARRRGIGTEMAP